IGNKVPISLMNGSSAPAELSQNPENSSSRWPKIGEHLSSNGPVPAADLEHILFNPGHIQQP
ncbi:hypothetical protein ACCT09_48200, partial [Rhizobium ruizarguesonis]